jgi:hypothetical protein
MKTIGIVGSRKRNSKEDFIKCLNALKEIYEEGDYLMSGGCPQGADNFAEQIARELGLTIIIHHANWKKYGKRAGIIRNQFIADDCNVLIALVAEDRKGGTEDTVKKVEKKGKKVILA